MQVLGFHFVKNAKNKEILHVTGSNPVQYVRTATSMTMSLRNYSIKFNPFTIAKLDQAQALLADILDK